jgi:hypothetical protein
MKQQLKVFYGFAKLTKKMARKREVVIQYENGKSNRNLEYLERRMVIIHTRNQTTEEMESSLGSHRMFTKWGYFVDDKRWKSNLDLVLENNFEVEENHVSKKERQEIRNKLEKEYYSFYNLERKPKGQQSLIFN